MIATVVLGGLGAGFVIMAKILLAVTLCFEEPETKVD